MMGEFDESVVVCYQRGYYPENTWPVGMEVTLMPKATDGEHLKRLVGFPKAFSVAKRKVRECSGPQVLYGFGLESGILACLLKRPSDRFVWEVADLPTAGMRPSLKKSVAEWLEMQVLKRCDRLVMTSRPMFDAHYRLRQPSSEDKLIVLENRLAAEYIPLAGTTKKRCGRPIRLGWTGFLRNAELYERLLKAVALDAGATVTLGIWGGGPGAEMARTFANASPNIQFHGTYRESPETLREIHSQMDVQVILDDSSNLNVRHAIPNRLFYCLAFETPMLVTAGTAKETRVRSLGVGEGVDEKSVDWQRVFERLASQPLIDGWLENLKHVPMEQRFLDSGPLIDVVRQWTH